MRESAERMQYITEYVVSYKTKIEALNKNGLFDAATLFEIFAKKICEIWFGKGFFNLNSKKSNFPYVDLLSVDNELYVQVSTTSNVPAKIKSTLEKIRDSKCKDLDEVKELFFVVLSNDSIENVGDFIGESQIGKIAFSRNKNLITTDDIIQKAKTDIDFQIALYDFLQSENHSLEQIRDEFEQAIKLSKGLVENNIDCLLNDEYLIDRTNLITKIKDEDKQFVSIQGEAGTGKSALCKMLLQDEEMVLYTRAEKISEAKNLEDIWGFDICKAIKYINQRKLIIYIDALEFIADSPKTKLDLLQQIYEIAKGYENVYVVTSCRTCDRTAFVKIESIYNIRSYEVPLLSDNQILGIVGRYRIIKELWDEKSYIQLLRSPFYVNLIIKNIKDFKKIDDVDGFRNLIWKDVMCMSDKSLPDGINHTDIKNSIEKIVFERAKKFLPGIKKESIGLEIIEFLKSENIITSCGDDLVRLKYDIFEDICFERFIDDRYDECKNDYDIFFNSISSVGRCMYRRYQIWVENKLFTKANREKFLFKLLETDSIPDVWKTQTIVGIVKSNFCGDFFEEYSYSISDDLLWDFVKLTNNFAFEISILNIKYENVYSKLKPVGVGRPCLINLIYSSGVYKNNIYEAYIRKLCDDYSWSFPYNDLAAEAACIILEFYVEEKMEVFSKNEDFYIAENINRCLLPIYRMVKVSQVWVKNFWENRINGYLNGDKRFSRLDEEILEYVLKNTVPALAQIVPRELCEIADAYWLKTPECYKRDFYHSISRSENTYRYGLSPKADTYRFKYSIINENSFLVMIIKYNVLVALDWIIKLTNNAAVNIQAISSETVCDICVWEKTPDDKKKYIGNLDFWITGTDVHRDHELISDAIFLFTQWAIEIINSKSYDENFVIWFGELIKSEIIKKANNIMMLSIISEIGKSCDKILPGYCLFLASSIDLVMLDIQKMALLTPSPEVKLLEKLILMTAGIPELENRYDCESRGNDTLQDYVLKIQLLGDDNKAKAEEVLDYLYSTVPNQGEYAILNLQIQKMDLRNVAVNKIDENTYAFIPFVKGEAKKIVEENNRSKYNMEREALGEIISGCNTLVAEGNFGLQECLDTIKQLQMLIKQSTTPGQLQNTLIMIIACALSQKEISIEKRSELCSIWLDGIEQILQNNAFAFEIILVKVLYRQFEFELENEIKIRMKKQMLECFLYRGHNGVVSKISSLLKEYLRENEKLAKCIFNTIIGISEDRMDCFQYNVSKLGEIGMKYEYLPNKNNPPVRVNDIFSLNKIEPYQSRVEEIVEHFLIQELDMDLSNWKVENCDIQTLCYISNCGLTFENEAFRMVMKELFPYMLSIMSDVKNYYEFCDTYAINEVKDFVKESLINNENVSPILNMFFDFPEHAHIISGAYEFYEDVSRYLLVVYRDGYNDVEVRKRCEDVIKSIEVKIINIDNDKVRDKLCSLMFLTLGKNYMGNWNKAYTEYSYRDKMFLNTIWCKYGWLHFKDLLYVIDQMNISALLPEVLIPLVISIHKVKKDFWECERIVNENGFIINKIITKAFLDYTDTIKSDHELIEAFEKFLAILIEFDMEEAAVILDEFRVH